MGEQPKDPRSDRRNYMPLREDKARCLAADLMTTPDLWKYVLHSTKLVREHIEAHQRREAFYAAVRLEQALDELYLRGEQLKLGTALREPHSALQHWQEDGR